MSVEPASSPDELPPPSAELVLVRVIMAAHLSQVSRKKGEALLRAIGEALASEEALSQVVLIRPPAQAREVQKARRGALALYRGFLPTWLNALRDK